jgi:hypothetical protein
MVSVIAGQVRRVVNLSAPVSSVECDSLREEQLLQALSLIE